MAHSKCPLFGPLFFFSRTSSQIVCRLFDFGFGVAVDLVVRLGFFSRASSLSSSLSIEQNDEETERQRHTRREREKREGMQRGEGWGEEGEQRT